MVNSGTWTRRAKVFALMRVVGLRALELSAQKPVQMGSVAPLIRPRLGRRCKTPTDFGPACAQRRSPGAAFATNGSEDCLTINVWTPGDLRTHRLAGSVSFVSRLD